MSASNLPAPQPHRKEQGPNDPLWIASEKAAENYYEGSDEFPDKPRRMYAYAMGFYHGKKARQMLPSDAPSERFTYFVGNANGRGLIRIEISGTGEHIASMPRGEKSERYAAFICKAANSHQKLVEALILDRAITTLGFCEAALLIFHENGYAGRADMPSMLEFVKMKKAAALSAATEEAP